jgi:hypothetical protein
MTNPIITGPAGVASQHHDETLMFATYYAPRGRVRLYMLGHQLAQRYLLGSDLLIGIIGAEGSGKSTLIRGLFPGLELTNDDAGVNIRKAPIFHFSPDDFFAGHTFHLDVRYELAFHQMFEIVNAINAAINHGRRVTVEHFDLVHKALGYNAQIIFGIGEEVIVARPSVFGPYPEAIKKVVDRTIKYRLMAHSAEDITSLILKRDYNYTRSVLHSDVKHGFIIKFPEKPAINITELEKKVKGYIAKDLSISIAGEDLIGIGDEHIYCTGTRTHVKSTAEIKNFRLLKELTYDPISKDYMLVGTVGKKESVGYEDISEDLEKEN